MEAKKQKEMEAKRRSEAAQAAEASRKAAIDARRKTVETERAPDELILQIEAEGVDGDEELQEALDDFHKVRDYVQALQNRQLQAEEHEAEQIAELDRKLQEEKDAFRKHASQGIALYTDEEAEDIARQASKSKEIIATLRKQNEKMRDDLKSMKEEMRGLYVHNQRLEEAMKTTSEFQEQLNDFENKESGKQEQLESMATKYKEAIDEHTEALEMRTIAGESENKIKQIYEKLTNRLVVKFQNECTDDLLVLELGSLALGEMAEDDEEEEVEKVGKEMEDNTERVEARTEKEAMTVSRSFHQYSDYSNDSSEEEEDLDDDDDDGIG